MSYKTPREIDALREAARQNIQATHRYVREQRIIAQEPTDYLFGAINQHAKQAIKLYPAPEPIEATEPETQEQPQSGFWDGVRFGVFLTAAVALFLVAIWILAR